VCALVLLAGCARDSRGAAGALATLEGLAFVPPGETVLPARLDAPVVCENREPLLVQRYEVTRAALRAWVQGAGPGLDPALANECESWNDATQDWPASFMTHAEAQAYTRALGLRLPTAREWLRIASGTGSPPWPWGPIDVPSAANTLTLRLDRPCPVGTFEQGRTPLGTYDMIGNVWEWVDDPIPRGLEPVRATWAMGGSYASRQRRLFETGDDGRLDFAVQELDPALRASDLGLRGVADAREWLRAHARELERGPDARARLANIGARWGASAAPWLARLAREDGAPACFTWLREGAER
jgi:hypothetical protein